MPLTPEEELELQQLDNEINKAPSPGLSPEEEAELEALNFSIEAMNKPRKLESLARGIAQGASLGFADEIAGGIEAAFTDKSYEQARDESRAAFEKAKQANMAFYYGGELVGGLASGIAAGPAAAGMRGAAILGGLYSVGSSNKTGGELLGDAAIGAALGAAGEKVLRGIGQYASRLVRSSSPEAQATMQALSNATNPIAPQVETNWLKYAYSKGYKSADEALVDPLWRNDITTFMRETPTIMKDVIRKAKEPFQSKYQMIEIANKDVSIDFLNSNSYKELLDQTSKLIPDGDARRWVENFEKMINTGDLAGSVSDGTSFKQLMSIKHYIDDSYSHFDDSFGEKVVSQFRNDISELLNNADITGSLREVNKSYSLLKGAEKVIPNTNKTVNTKELADMFQTLDSVKGNTLFENLQLFDAREGTTFAQQMINEAKPIVDSYVLTDMMQFKTNFDQATSLTFRGRALGSISPVLTPLALGEAPLLRLVNQAGKVSAKVAGLFKIPRTLNGVLENAPIISKKLAIMEPSSAIMFNEAYDRYVRGEDQGELANLIKRGIANPALNPEFEPGIGFDGKIATPQEMGAVLDSIKSGPFSLKQKMQLSQQVKSTGIIPRPEETKPEPVFYKVYQASKRNNQDKKVTDY